MFGCLGNAMGHGPGPGARARARGAGRGVDFAKTALGPVQDLSVIEHGFGEERWRGVSVGHNSGDSSSDTFCR